PPHSYTLPLHDALPILNPANANTVKTYGAIDKYTCGTSAKIGTPELMTLKLWAKPKNKAAPIAPSGCHFPKITAAKAINPCPAIDRKSTRLNSSHVSIS